MTAIVTFEADEKIYLLTGKDNAVVGFNGVNDGLAYFERAYTSGHARGYEASMSACINYITFHPSVHEWNNEDLSPLVDMDVIVQDTFRVYSLRHISGFMTGALLTGNKAREFHESGKVPSLIAQ